MLFFSFHVLWKNQRNACHSLIFALVLEYNLFSIKDAHPSVKKKMAVNFKKKGKQCGKVQG
jgi:hypothetical protein